MFDILGQEIKVGDYISFIHYTGTKSYPRLKFGEVVEICNEYCMIHDLSNKSKEEIFFTGSHKRSLILTNNLLDQILLRKLKV